MSVNREDKLQYQPTPPTTQSLDLVTHEKVSK